MQVTVRARLRRASAWRMDVSVLSAGARSSFFRSADSQSESRALVSFRKVAECLDEWANYAESGLAEQPFVLRTRVVFGR
jgi:hypothetical protein